MNNDVLEKGKSMPIGTIHNGFKKIAEGKWRKVSNEGKTKEEHKKESDRYSDKAFEARSGGRLKAANEYKLKTEEHQRKISKLDSKEYSDQEVLGKEEYKRGDKIKVQESGDWHEGEYVGKDSESHHKVKIKNSIGVYSPRTVHSSAIKRNDKEVEKALTILEIGYLNGEVDRNIIEKARAAALGTRVTHADGVTREKTVNGWRPVKKGDGGKKEESNLEVERQSVKQDTSLSYEERSKKLKDLEDKDLLSKEKEMDKRHNEELKSHYDKTKAHWDKYNSIAKKGYHTPEELKEHNKGTEKLGKEYNELMERHFQEKHGLVKEMMGEKKNSQILGHTKSGKPIIKDKNPEEYKDFTPEDHRDAAKLLGDIDHIIDLVSISNNKYSDIKKIKLEKTPKGNWRAYYDGKDTGLTIGGKQIQDSVVKQLGLEYHEED